MIRSCAAAALCMSVVFLVAARVDDPKSVAGVSSDLVTAEQLYNSGKFDQAAAGYRLVLKNEPRSIEAQAGLIRSLRRAEHIDEAYAVGQDFLAAQPNSALLLSAMGELQFRRAQMTEAELDLMKAEKAEPQEVSAYLGLARLYRVYSLYRRSYDQLKKAHDIAPNDLRVQRAWWNMLPRKDRIAAIQAYLAGPHPDNQEETESLQRSLAFLKATADQPLHSCKLASTVERTETKLEQMFTDPKHIRGVGLTVKLNDHASRLLLDTGASGILLNRKAAEKAGLTRISEDRIGGIGDKGVQTSYTAHADVIRIGELEFHDCVVRVSDRNSLADEDGLVGSDVFASYLVDIDMPALRLRLEPLPKRPEQSATQAALNTEGDNAEEKPAGGDEHKNDATHTGDKTAVAPAHLPYDRYIAPEMADWAKVFRFGHQLLIFTRVNDSKPMLFGIDTGSWTNLISTNAAKQVTKITPEANLKVKGLNGRVDNVYLADKVNLQFSHYRQNGQEVVTIDLSHLSESTGTEISGLLGFAMLRARQFKIDYRDGLVDFQ